MCVCLSVVTLIQPSLLSVFYGSSGFSFISASSLMLSGDFGCLAFTRDFTLQNLSQVEFVKSEASENSWTWTAVSSDFTVYRFI